MPAGWEVIIPFLRPIEHLLRDLEISDILVNGSTGVFVEKAGRLREEPGIVIAEKSLQVAIKNIARILGLDVSEEQPLLDARLPDGSRVAAVFPPCSVNGTTLAIRKFQSRRYDAAELVRVGTLSAELLRELETAIRTRQSMLISGPTGAGKTTFLNALAAFIGPEERVIVIEDTAEIQIANRDLVRLEARREQPGLRAVTMRDLLTTTLRLRPDRILLGEIRKEEAFELLQALNTGHRGTLSTVHANSAADSLERFATCVLMSGLNIAYPIVCRQIGHGLNWLVHLDRVDGLRRVMEVARVKGYDAGHDRYDLETLYAA